jgi:hypothetical protein
VRPEFFAIGIIAVLMLVMSVVQTVADAQLRKIQRRADEAWEKRLGRP